MSANAFLSLFSVILHEEDGYMKTGLGKLVLQNNLAERNHL
jgi:hypothetical protein